MTEPASPEFLIYVAGLATPFVVIALVALASEARERIGDRIRKRIHSPKGIFIGSMAYCPVRSCNYSCAAFLEGRRRQRKSVLNSMAEHKAEKHPSEEVSP